MLLNDFIGYISVLFHLVSFKAKDRKNILILGAIATILYTINIYGNGAHFGTLVISIISILFFIISYYSSLKHRTQIAKIVPVIAFGVFIFTGMDLMSFLAAVGTLFANYAKLEEDVLQIKIIYLFSASSWLIIGILLNSIPAILFDAVGIAVLLTEIYKIKTSKENKK